LNIRHDVTLPNWLSIDARCVSVNPIGNAATYTLRVLTGASRTCRFVGWGEAMLSGGESVVLAGSVEKEILRSPSSGSDGGDIGGGDRPAKHGDIEPLSGVSLPECD
jgi:hypothetical protein